MTQKLFWLLGLLACLLAATPARAQVRPDSLPATAAAPPDTAARLPAAVPDSGAAPDTAAAQAAAPGSYEENDFNPGLGLFALFAVGVMLAAVGVGIVLALLAVALAAGLLAVGVVSSAALVGLWQRSWWAALRALLWVLALLGGAAAGGAMGVGVQFLRTEEFDSYALAIGAGAGLLLGGVAAYTCQRVVLLVLAAARRRWPEWLGAGQ